MLHDLVSVLWPTQSFPPWAGLGFVHLRVLNWVPPPHFLLHTPKPDHWLKPPSTIRKKKIILRKLGHRNNNKSNMAAIIIEKEKNESYISYLQIEFAHDRAIPHCSLHKAKLDHWLKPLFTVKRNNCRKVVRNRKHLHLHWYVGIVWGWMFYGSCWFVHIY